MYIRVSVTAGAKKEFLEEGKEKLSIFVREPADKNRANKRVLEIVAQRFKVSLGKVKIITGHKSPRKILEIIK